MVLQATSASFFLSGQNSSLQLRNFKKTNLICITVTTVADTRTMLRVPPTTWRERAHQKMVRIIYFYRRMISLGYLKNPR